MAPGRTRVHYSLVLTVRAEELFPSEEHAPAKDGASALKALDDQSFDVAFLDYKLPDMDGLELLKKVQAQCPEMAVVMITSKGLSPSSVKEA